MIVDDDASVRVGLGRLMRCAGYAVETFASPSEFLAAAPPSGPACLVLDVRMRDLGGLALKERLNQNGNHIPVIMITADEGMNLREEAVALGAAGFFRKPVDGRSLVDAIEFALSQEPLKTTPRRQCRD
ncbi:MAG: response regulator [Methylococcaceae bacterium]|nr:response regulator [Methylococcaceae bacterium]